MQTPASVPAAGLRQRALCRGALRTDSGGARGAHGHPSGGLGCGAGLGLWSEPSYPTPGALTRPLCFCSPEDGPWEATGPRTRFTWGQGDPDLQPHAEPPVTRDA